MAKKSAKLVKKYPARKLPKLFRKKYSAKKYEKKILKKIYVPKDRKDVESLFEKSKDSKNHVVYSVPQEKEFTKAELKNYKVIAKQIKGQKGRIKFLPLIACLSFIVVLCVAVVLFKNPLAKMILINASENAFGAKTEIDSVNVEIFGAQITVKGLSVGNKNNVMTNLFEAELIDVDFDLTQALRGRFNAENLEVTGVNFNTPRTTSCALPLKEKKEEAEKKDSQFMKDVQNKNGEALVALQEMAKEVAGGGNPQEIADGIISSLSTPALVEEAKSSGEKLVATWSGKPEQMASQVEKFASDVQRLSTIDPNKITNVEELKSDLEKINSAINSGNAIKNSCEAMNNDFNRDFNELKTLSSKAENGIKKDMAFAQKKVNGLVSTVSNPQKLFNQALDTVGYAYLGKYYSYVEKVYSYARTVKITSQNKAGSSNSKEKPKKENSNRLAGTTFWYKTEQPSFLIEKMHVSGPGFDASVKELNNDPDLRGLPTVAQLVLEAGGVNHKGKVVVDARSASDAPLIKGEYLGQGFDVDFDGKSVAQKCGVPSIQSKADLKVYMTMDWNETAAGIDVQGNGSVYLKNASVTSDGFENEVITSYYNDALSCVRSLSMDFTAGFTSDAGLTMALNGNFNDFVNGFRKSAANASKDLQNAVMAKVKESVSGYSAVLGNIMSDPNSMKASFDKESKVLKDAQKQLEKKQAEIEKQIKTQAAKAGSDVIGGALKGFGL